MRAAEERYPGYPDTIPELMDRAGGAVAREAMLAYPEATRFACVCGGGSNGGDGRVAARVLREAGHVADEVDEGFDDYDVVIDALFGTGFHGAPAPRGGVGHRADQRVAGCGRLGRPAFGRRRIDGRDRGRGGGRRPHGDLPRLEGRARRRAGSVQRRARRRRRASGSSDAPTEIVVRRPRSSTRCRAGASETRSTAPGRSSSWGASRG